MNRHLLYLSVSFLVIAIVLASVTYSLSNRLVESYSSSASLAYGSVTSHDFNLIPGNTIVIRGNASGPVFIIFSPFGYTFGPFNRTINLIFNSNISGQTEIVFEALPTNSVNISYSIMIYNTWFNNYGYPLSIFFGVLGIIFLLYSLAMKEKKISPKKASKKISRIKLS